MNPNKLVGTDLASTDTLEIRRQLKRKMMRDFPLHSAGWNLERLVSDGKHDPDVKEARPKDHLGSYNLARDYYHQHLQFPGRHRRVQKHRGIPEDKYAHLSYTVPETAAA